MIRAIVILSLCGGMLYPLDLRAQSGTISTEANQPEIYLIYFKPNTATLSPLGHKVVQIAAQAANHPSVQVTVSGHLDSKELNDNSKLADRRARTVAQALIKAGTRKVDIIKAEKNGIMPILYGGPHAEIRIYLETQ